MAIYDRDATPATAVAAWLSQFKVDASGDITFVSGTDTFHVWWLHRALQKIAWDFAISGDDEINLSKPNPSTSEALGTIITLLDHTADYGVKYTVTPLVMEYHFGGSLSYDNGNEIYYGLQVLGQVATPMPIKILQNNLELTSHWGNGKNQTDANTLLRACILGTTGGADVDNLLVHVKLSTWQYTYAVWGTTLGLGEKVASVSSEGDPQNTSVLVTVQAYGIAKSEGYNLLDLDGAGNKPYLGEWSYSPQSTKKALYEFVKAILVDGSTDTLYGVDGDLWTGRLIDCSVDGAGTGAGTWVQNETLSWGTGATAGTGHLVGVDSLTGTATTRLILHLDTGVAPINGVTLAGATGLGDLDADGVLMSTNVNHLGQFTGAWIGALGIGFDSNEIGSVDSFRDLDGNTVTPPNNVSIQGSVVCGDTGDDPHVFLAPSAAGVIDLNVYSCTGESIGAGVIRVDAIASDTPQTGYIGVLKTGTTTYKFYEYVSWTGTTFTLAGTIADDAITAADPAFHAIFYESAVGAGLTKTVSNSLIYTAPIEVSGWVRHGDPAIPDKPVLVTGTIGAAGLSFSVTLEDES